MKTRKALAYLLMAMFIVFMPACSEDDIPTVPEVPEYEDPVLATLTTEGAVIAQGMVDLFPSVATDNLGAKDTTDPVYDEGCQCWVWSSFEEYYGGPENSWYRSWNFEVTFLKDEVPQMDFVGADKFTVQMGYSFIKNTWEDEDNSSYETFWLNQFVEIMPLGDGLFGVSGSGLGGMNAYITTGGEEFEVNEEFIVSLDLTVPLAACPTGMFTLDFDPASFSISFGHDGVAHWDYQAGPGEPETGEFTLQCGE